MLFSTVKNRVYRAPLAKPRAQQILAMCLPFSSAFIMSNVTSVQADLCWFLMGLHQEMQIYISQSFGVGGRGTFNKDKQRKVENKS
jgi:hypothetical protein